MGKRISSDQHNDAFDLDILRALVARYLGVEEHSLDKVAVDLKLSPRTLQRRLADYGLTYTQLVDEVRFMRARKLIINQSKMVNIASELGYTDAGSFTRAFERWTGMTPQHYRKKFCNGSTASLTQGSK